MAYADTIRASTCGMADVATLIEGIYSSGYPLTWTAWTPTFRGGGSLTFNCTSYFARYLRCGKLIIAHIEAGGTTTGTTDMAIRFTLPVNAAYNFSGGAMTSDGSWISGFVTTLSATEAQVWKGASVGWAANATIAFRTTFVYEGA